MSFSCALLAVDESVGWHRLINKTADLRTNRTPTKFGKRISRNALGTDEANIRSGNETDSEESSGLANEKRNRY